MTISFEIIKVTTFNNQRYQIYYNGKIFEHDCIAGLLFHFCYDIIREASISLNCKNESGSK